MEWIKLKEMRVSTQRVDYYFDASEPLKKWFLPDLHMFVQYDFAVQTIPAGILIIPFLGNVMQIAWLTDAQVFVDTIDKTFFESLPRLRDAYRKMYPNCPLNGEICVENLEDNSHATGANFAQMYTGGLDATTTFVRHYQEKPILIQEYGFFDERFFIGEDYASDEKSERNFASDAKAAKCFAEMHGAKTAFIRSNYGTFIKSTVLNKYYQHLLGDDFWHGLHHAMALLSAAAPVCYKSKVKTLYIASSFSVGNTYPCASDPTTDNEFRFAGTCVCHDGYELTDQDKARLAVAFQRKYGASLPLRVCSWNDHNCCSCEKCLRRILQINAEGGNPANFGFHFDSSVLDITERYLWKEIQFFTAKNIDKWGKIIQRMRDNYENIYDKAVADFLFTYDFEKEKRRGLCRYYRTNFFSILKRKIKGLLTRGD